MRAGRVGGAVGLVLAGLLLAGCGVLKPGVFPTGTVTVTVTPTPSASSTPSASASPAASVTTAPTAGSTGGAAGCTNDGSPIPAGSDTARLTAVDVDGDGLTDTEFYTHTDPLLTFGLRTGAGGTYLLHDDLAGPNQHSGWIAAFDAAAGRLVVLDDGRSATLHAFVDCRFVTTRGVDGKPYTFTLAGFGDRGTGVACNDRNGGTLLEGVDAVRRSDGRYDIRWTQIDVSADGTTATNGATETRWSGLAADDPRVRASMGSHCGDAPKVSSDGK